MIATVALLIKDRMIARRIRLRARQGEVWERVLLAGVPKDIAALEQSLTKEESILLQVADRIDIEKQPISDLVEAMHRHGSRG